MASLIRNDHNKELIVDNLKKLSDEGFVTIYAFVIMPNHIHLVWQHKKLNGKKTPKGSLLNTLHTLFLSN
jgi:REP element-mobilizing transposase RayT